MEIGPLDVLLISALISEEDEPDVTTDDNQDQFLRKTIHRRFRKDHRAIRVRSARERYPQTCSALPIQAEA